MFNVISLFKKPAAPVMETREARIILPLMDNRGESLSFIHSLLRQDLLARFGGFTASHVSGHWRDADSGFVYSDESIAFDIAAIWTRENCEALNFLASRYALWSEQVCLYVRHGNGAVCFIGPENIESRSYTAKAA